MRTTGNATILKAQAMFCFPSEPNIPEGPDYEPSKKY